jgi:hypothetical protein
VPTARTANDRQRFFAELERILAAPVTKNGPSRTPDASWRSGTFVTHVTIGVDALEDGTMRVHLLSDHDRGRAALRALERKQRAGSLPDPRSAPVPRLRVGPNGKRVYFGFEWTRTGGYCEELETIRSFVEWFFSARRELPGEA